jgi:hypothetical protein
LNSAPIKADPNNAMNYISIPLRRIITLVVWMLFLTPIILSAQPIVNAVIPATARAGEQVTITGSGFSATANSVWIGTLPAQVVSQAANSITIRVPDFAAYGKVKVLNQTTGLMGESITQF